MPWVYIEVRSKASIVYNFVSIHTKLTDQNGKKRVCDTNTNTFKGQYRPNSSNSYTQIISHFLK